MINNCEHYPRTAFAVDDGGTLIDSDGRITGGGERFVFWYSKTRIVDG